MHIADENIPLADLQERYLDFLTKERALSVNTVAAYRRDLNSLFSYMESVGEPLNLGGLSTGVLRGWIVDARKRGITALSVKRRLSAASGFCRFVSQRINPEFANPAEGLKPPKSPKPLPSFIKPSETENLLSDLANPDTPLIERLVVELLYSTGIRCQELIDLRNEAVDTTNRRMRVMGKRRKERIVPLTPMAAELIDEFRMERGTAAGPLLLRGSGKPLSRRKVYEIVHRHMVESGVHATRLSPHTLRHSCATDLLNNGADLNSVKELLGHASLSTTQVYTHLNYNDLLKNYAAAHPRAAITTHNN